MDNGLKIRTMIFNDILKEGQNKRNWEMLCSLDKPWIPFVGAGISAWCYPTWNNLLKDIVSEIYGGTEADIVAEALETAAKLQETNGATDSNTKGGDKFYWMEEIAECIFDDDRSKYRAGEEKFPVKGVDEKERNILQRLRFYVGESGLPNKRAAQSMLYRTFAVEKLHEGKKIPEYQQYFSMLFKDVLLTTNYDRAFEQCYPSILSYTYKDLGAEKKENSENNETNGNNANNENNKNNENDENNKSKSWLYDAFIGKIERMKNKAAPANVAVPDMPMLLKVHGSIEQGIDMALTRSGYDLTYEGSMPELLQYIFAETTVIFFGYGLRRDRIMEKLRMVKCENDDNKKNNNNKKIRHFAFLYGDPREEKKFTEELEKNYGVYPIFYKEDMLPLELFHDKQDRKNDCHDFCLGLLLENLLRRKIFCPQPLELLWDRDRFQKTTTKIYVKELRRDLSRRLNPHYVHMEEAGQIWRLLDLSKECPTIAITGSRGSGRSTIYNNLIELQQGNKDLMRFFYISFVHCYGWEDFCIQIFQAMNIDKSDIPKRDKWKEVAESISNRCRGYWKSVLVLDHIDQIMKREIFPDFWSVFKSMLAYWKEHQTRVIFICEKYPQDIPCHTWHIENLNDDDAKEVFFSACTTERYRDITYNEESVITELCRRQKFRASSIELLGAYANSKGDLTSLLDEWELYHLPGDTDEQTVTRILTNHLLNEYKQGIQLEAIKKNILWVWGILAEYPGTFSSVFFEEYLKTVDDETKELTERTLMYMKNIGLCEEGEDEKEQIMLDNIIKCVDTCFVDKVCTAEQKKSFKCKIGFAKRREERLHCGLSDFRGYKMRSHRAGLLKYVFPELQKDKTPDSDQDILDILLTLSKSVNTNEARIENQRLNQVLHYEIKAIIRFLIRFIYRKPSMEQKEQIKESSTEQKEQIKKLSTEQKEQILEIAYNLSHFYHYAPQNAYSFVTWVVESIKNEDKHLCKCAKMYKELGDIQKLLGRKKDAMESYQKAIECCNRYLLNMVGVVSRDYVECIRIKAGALLAKNSYHQFADNGETKEAAQLYERISDVWGRAYYYQKKGECKATQIKYTDKINEKKAAFISAMKDFNSAIELFGEKEDFTGLAYILKIMGDLICKCNEIYEDKYCLQPFETKKGEFYYQITDKTRNSSNNEYTNKGDWKYAAAICYLHSFFYYYRHINWRGFANVLQAMGTCFRTIRGKENMSDENVKNMETIYEMAEECYRWLGDIQGLADTLDYFGHGYEMGGGKYLSEALGKWCECEIKWKELDNDVKVEMVKTNISKLFETSESGA